MAAILKDVEMLRHWTNVGGTLSESEIRDIIEHGQGGMPGGIIKGEELDAVAKWLAEKK